MCSVVAADDSEEFLTRLAWLYFVAGMTQSEVAAELGITRLRVNKGLAAARQRGLVRIELASPFAPGIALESRLVERFGLRAAHVGIADRTTYDPHAAVGAALAYFLEDGLNRDLWRSIGVSWGKTLENALRGIRPRSLPDLEIISMIGGTMIGKSFNSFGVAANMAARLGASHSVLAAPIYFETREMTQAVLASRAFRTQLEKAQKVDVAILVTGDLTQKSYLVRYGLPDGVLPASLAEKGAVGDVLGQFFDAQGRLIDHPINDCVVGVPVSALRGMQHVVLAAAGLHKVEIILAQLRAGYIHTLITDDVTAELVLRAAG